MSTEKRFGAPASSTARAAGVALVVLACVSAASVVQARCRASAPQECLKPGEVDPSFAGGGQPVVHDLGNGPSRGAMDMAVAPDGRIVMGGSSSLDSGYNHDATLARFTSEGVLDATFGTDGVQRLDLGPGNTIVQSVAVQADGKILAAGGRDADPARGAGTTTGYYPKASFLARLQADGSLDASFGAGGVIVAAADYYRAYQRVLVQSDGKVLAIGFGGDASSQRGYFVERYDASGALDPTFGSGGVAVTTGSGFSWTPFYRAGAALQPDGKILIAGSALGGVGEYLNCALARFDESGVLDPSFGGGERLVAQARGDVCKLEAVVPLADGKILASGAFYSDPVTQAFALMRFHADGSLDTHFGRGGRALTSVAKDPVTIASHALAVQSDGRILQAGSEGGMVLDLTRHRANGRADSSFRRLSAGPGVVRVDRPYGARTAVFDGAQAVALLPDGRILVGGNPGYAGTFALVRILPQRCLYDPRGPTVSCE